jgi:tetratricopeptide (TPR) repeat protein
VQPGGLDQELGTIESAVAAVAGGGSRTVGIFGEAGVGKSALLGAAADSAASSGLQMLAAAAVEEERYVPFRLVLGALGERVAGADPRAIETAGPAERWRYHRALRSQLERLGRERPIALLLDDLDRADEASLELVLYLLRRPPRAPHLLLFALAPGEAEARLIEAARSASGWVELHPGPLATEAELPGAARVAVDGDAATHERAARELERSGAAPGRLAYHVERYAKRGDDDAIALLAEAAAESADAAPATAAHLYAAAVALIPPDETERRARLLAPMARVLASSGRLEESRAPLAEALELLPAEAAAERLELRRLSALAAALLGSYEAAEREVDRALAEAPTPQRAKLYLYRAAIPFLRGQFEAVAPWVERAGAEHDGGEEAVSAHLEAMQAQVRVYSGRPGGELIESAVHRFQELDEAAIAAYPDVVWGLGGTLNQLERYGHASAVLGRGIEVLRASRQDHLLLHLEVLASRAALAMLDLDRALALIDAAEETARLEGLDDQLGFALWQRGQVLAARGESGEAARAAAESDRMYASGRQGLGARVTRADNAIVRFGGDPERLLAEVAAAAGTTVAEIDTVSASGSLPALVRAAIAAGRLEDAQRWVERTEAFAQGAELPAGVARAARGRTEILLARGEAKAAGALAAEAAEIAAGTSAHLEELELRLLSGRALLAAGRRDDGVAVLHEVVRAAAAARAVAAAEEAARALERAGSPPAIDLRAPAP